MAAYSGLFDDIEAEPATSPPSRREPTAAHRLFDDIPDEAPRLSKGALPNGLLPGREGNLDASKAGDKWATFEVSEDGNPVHLVLPIEPGDNNTANDETGFLGDAVERYRKTGQSYGGFDSDELGATFMNAAATSKGTLFDDIPDEQPGMLDRAGQAFENEARANLRSLPETPGRDTWMDWGRKLAASVSADARAQVGSTLLFLAENPPVEGGMPADQIEALQKAAKVARGNPAETIGGKIYASAAADIAENAPNVDPFSFKDIAFNAARSIPAMLTAFGAGVVTRNPVVGYGVLGGQVGAQQYGESRLELGRSPEASTLDAAFNALAEIVGEEVPVGILMKPGSTFMGRTLKAAGAEALQEEATQVLQTGYDKGILHPDMPLGEALQQLAMAPIVGGVTGGAIAAAVHPFVGGGAGGAPQEQTQSVPIDTSQTQPPRGARATHLAATDADRLLTEGDRASPLPNDLIAQGKMLIEDMVGSEKANVVLRRNGWPDVGSPVSVERDGKVQNGTVQDAFATSVPELGASGDGVVIKLDDGSRFEALKRDLEASGTTIAKRPTEPAGGKGGLVEPAQRPEPSSPPAPGPVMGAGIFDDIPVEAGFRTTPGAIAREHDEEMRRLETEAVLRGAAKGGGGTVAEAEAGLGALQGGPAAPIVGTSAAPESTATAKLGSQEIQSGFVPNGDGTRESPVVVSQAGHMEPAHGQVAAAPTDAQKEAGNYKKGHVKIQGLDITIENPEGTERTGVDKSGKPWSETMPASYGYFKRTEGADGDQVDVYVGPQPESPRVFVVDQLNAETGKYDEHKVMLGFADRAAAVMTYARGFSDGKAAQRIGGVTEMSIEQFRDWVKNSDTTKPATNGEAPQLSTDRAIARAAPQRFVANADDRNVISTGARLRSKSGRELSPVPKVDGTSERKTGLTLKRIDTWLLNEARIEAQRTGHGHMATVFEGLNPERLSQADRDLANDWLFGRASGATAANVIGGGNAGVSGAIPRQGEGDVQTPQQARVGGRPAQARGQDRGTGDRGVGANQTQDEGIAGQSAGAGTGSATAGGGTAVRRTGPSNRSARTREPRDRSLFATIRAAGGLKLRDANGITREGGEVLAVLKDVKTPPGFINNKSGMTPDYMREHLAEHGWFQGKAGAGADIQSLYDALNREARGDRVYHPTAERASESIENGEISAENVEAAGAAVVAIARRYQEPLSVDDIKAISEIVLGGYDPESAVIEHVERRAIERNDEFAQENPDGGYEEIPFESGLEQAEKSAPAGIERPEAQQQEQGGGGNRGPPAGEVQAAAGQGAKAYYVTVIRDPGPHQQVGWLAGPFATHQDALAMVEPARKAASEADPFTDFDAFGTTARQAVNHPPGRLNSKLGLPNDPRAGKTELATEPGAVDARGRALPQTIVPGAEQLTAEEMRAREIQKRTEEDKMRGAPGQKAVTGLGLFGGEPESTRDVSEPSLFAPPSQQKPKSAPEPKQPKANELAGAPGHKVKVAAPSAADTGDNLSAVAESSKASTDEPAFARRQESPIFYSALTRAIEAVKQERGPASQWLGIIKNMPGVRAEEIEWSGVEQWLAQQGGPVTREQVVAFLRANEIQVQEVEKGGARDASELFPEDPGAWTEISSEKYEDGTIKTSVTKSGDALVTFHFKPSGDIRGVDAYWKNDGPRKFRDFIEAREWLIGESGLATEGTKFETYTLPGGENYRELLLTLPVVKADMNFSSGHFSEPNIVAHVRFNDRVDADGKKTLFVEEVQSDWHQKGRREGYDVPRGEEWAVYGGGQRITDGVTKEEAEAEAARIRSRPGAIPVTVDRTGFPLRGAVPNAPFKTTWPELAMKRMLRYAAENGYDQISWTTGEIQADRYDLSHRIKTLNVERIGGPGETQYVVQAQQHSGPQVNLGAHTAEKLPDIVGKDMADKIIKNTDKVQIYKGLDLKVGGEGMSAFYDRMLPSFLNKYAKKWGAKIGETRVPTEEIVAGTPVEVVEHPRLGGWTIRLEGNDEFEFRGVWRSKAEAEEGLARLKADPFALTLTKTVHSLPITQAMRDAVLQGQPLFARRPEIGGLATAARTERLPDGTRLQFSPKFEAARAALADRIQAHLSARNLGDAIAVRVADAIRTFDGQSADGFQLRSIINIALDAADPISVVDHEVIHALSPRALGLFTKTEWRVLEQRAESEWKAKYAKQLADYSEEWRTEEAIAFAAQEWGTARRSERGTTVGRLFQKMRDIIREIGLFLRGEGYLTADDVFRRIESGVIGARFSAATVDAPGPMGISPEFMGAESDGEPAFAKRRALSPNVPVATITFGDPKTEARFKAASLGVGDGASTLAKAREWWDYLRAGFSRHWINLPNVPKYANLQQQLRKLEAAPEASNEEIERIMRDLIGDMSRAEFELFRRKVILDDLSWESSLGHDLPFGLTSADIPRELAKVDAALQAHPNLRDRVRQRKLVVRTIADRLVRAGVLDKESVKNPAYYRHQVLDYAKAMRLGGKKRLKTPHWARRHGSEMDINANFLEAEFDWLRKALNDIKTAETIDWIKKSPHNIRKSVAAAARAHNESAVKAAIAADITTNGQPSAIEAQWKEFKQRIAMGFDGVRKAIKAGSIAVPPQYAKAATAIENNTADENALNFLGWIMDNNQPGSVTAATVFKAIVTRREWVKQLLGDNYADPADIKGLVKRGLAPDGYVTWQPDEGKLLYTAKTLPQNVLDRFIGKLAVGSTAEVAAMLGLPQSPDAAAFGMKLAQAIGDASKSVLAVGNDKYTMVIPEEVADTLNSLRDEAFEGVFGALFEVPLRAWKQWVLMNPLRVLKYNINNLSGDLDAIIAGNPGVVRYAGQSMRELFNVMAKGRPPTATYTDAVHRGVFNAGLTLQEIDDINALSGFEHLLSQESQSKTKRFLLTPLGKAWRALRGVTTFRENIMRYAAYLHYLDQMNRGTPMAKIGYGASVPQMVDSVTERRDKAALLARDLVGDYGNVSHFGRGIRRTTVPFWSWAEVNTKRYVRLLGNAYTQGIGAGLAKTGAVGGIIGLRTTAWLTLRMFMLYGMIQLWNNLLFGDDEDDLDPEQARQLHVLLGHNADGSINSLRVQGALSDFLAWAGFEDALGAISEVSKGRGSVVDILGAIAKAPVNKIVGGVTPMVSVPVELASGESFYPDLFNPIAVRDRWREVFRLFSFDPAYDLVLGKPTRGIGATAASALIYTRDPGEIAYDQVRGLVFSWRERVKGEGGVSTDVTPRSAALRDWRLGVRFGDDKAAKRAVSTMRELGMNAKDIQAALKRQAPLYNIPLKDRRKFLATLTTKERERFEEARRWYAQTFTVNARESLHPEAE